MTQNFEIRDPATGVLRFSVNPTSGEVTGIDTSEGDPGVQGETGPAGPDDSIHGMTIPIPGPDEDGMTLTYDDATESLVWTALS